MSKAKARLSIAILSIAILQIATIEGVLGDDSSLETISIQAGCVPKKIAKAVSDNHFSVWKIECKGGDQKPIYIECQKQECRAKARDERVDTTSGHR